MAVKKLDFCVRSMQCADVSGWNILGDAV